MFRLIIVASIICAVLGRHRRQHLNVYSSCVEGEVSNPSVRFTEYMFCDGMPGVEIEWDKPRCGNDLVNGYLVDIERIDQSTHAVTRINTDPYSKRTHHWLYPTGETPATYKIQVKVFDINIHQVARSLIQYNYIPTS